MVLEAGASLNGNFEIRKGEILPPGSTNLSTPMPPMTLMALQTFCNSNDYKAKESLASLAKPTVFEDKSQVQFKNYGLTITPNPVGDQMRVNFNLETESETTLLIFNTLGQVVKTTFMGKRDKGNYEEIIETNDLSAGIYFISLRTNKGSETKKIIKQN